MSTSVNEKLVNPSVIYKLILVGLSIPVIFATCVVLNNCNNQCCRCRKITGN